MQKEKVADSVKETIINELVPSVFNLFVEPEMTNLLTEIVDIPLKIELKMQVLMKCCLHENPDFSLNSLSLLAAFLQNNADEIQKKFPNEVVNDIQILCGLKRIELVIFFSKVVKTFENNQNMKKLIVEVIKKTTENIEIGLFECSMMQLYVEILLADGKKKFAEKKVAEFVNKIDDKEEFKDVVKQLKDAVSK